MRSNNMRKMETRSKAKAMAKAKAKDKEKIKKKDKMQKKGKLEKRGEDGRAEKWEDREAGVDWEEVRVRTHFVFGSKFESESMEWHKGFRAAEGEDRKVGGGQ